MIPKLLYKTFAAVSYLTASDKDKKVVLHYRNDKSNKDIKLVQTNNGTYAVKHLHKGRDNGGSYLGDMPRPLAIKEFKKQLSVENKDASPDNLYKEVKKKKSKNKPKKKLK